MESKGPGTPANPYVGPRAFQLHEAYFYGRGRETRELANLLTAERVVLLHSPSGAGKTSLIRAGLVPALQDDFDILPVIRVGRPPVVPANRYRLSAILSLEDRPEPGPSDPDLAQLARLTLEEYLRRHRPPGETPQLLIFDQFEEVLTADPYDQQGREEFFAELGELLRRARPPDGREGPPAGVTRWALFAVRDEFVAALSPYLKRLPTGISETYRLDLLGPEAALEAVRKPAEAVGVPFDEGAARRLVDNLRRARRPGGPGTRGEVLGPHVEPVQLQVVCYRLWERVTGEGRRAIGVPDVERSDVDNALADYYAERVRQAAGGDPVRERVLRVWVEQQLITPEGLRSAVREAAGAEGGPDPAEVQKLVDSFLVRREERRGLSWLELAHDRLIEPIQRDNERWLVQNLGGVQLQAVQWARQGRPRKLLVRGAALAEAERWVSRHEDRLTDVDRAYLEASRGAASAGDRLKGYLYRGWAYVATGVCLLLLTAVVSVGVLYRHANNEKAQADQARQHAEKAREQAEAEREKVRAALKLYQDEEKRRRAETTRANLADEKFGQFATSVSRKKIRPLQPGISVSSVPGGAGTICCLVHDRARKKHVFLLSSFDAIVRNPPKKGTPVVQPGVADDGDPDRDQVARLADWVPLEFGVSNPTGGAIAELLPDVPWNPRVLALGQITGVGEARVGQPVQMVGRTSPLSRGRVVGVHMTAKISYGDRFALFENLIVIEGESGPFSQAGDSGAPVLTQDGKLVGMLHAFGAGKAFVLPIQPILNKLNVELITEVPPARKRRSGDRPGEK